MEKCTNSATGGAMSDERAAGRALLCRQCGHRDVLRSRCFFFVERLAALVFMSPFRCQHCSHRFMALRLGVAYRTDLIDRREHRRIPVRLLLSFSGGRVRGKGMVLDMSMGGCVIQSDTHVQVNDIFYLQLYIEAQEPPIEVAAMVRSVTARGIGFKFLRAAREYKRLFEYLHARGA